MCELYDLAPDNVSVRNLSTRALVGTGDDVLIGGFIIGGEDPTKVMVRAIGPSLTSFGVDGALPDPSWSYTPLMVHLFLKTTTGAATRSNRFSIRLKRPPMIAKQPSSRLCRRELHRDYSRQGKNKESRWLRFTISENP